MQFFGELAKNKEKLIDQYAYYLPEDSLMLYGPICYDDPDESSLMINLKHLSIYDREHLGDLLLKKPELICFVDKKPKILCVSESYASVEIDPAATTYSPATNSHLKRILKGAIFLANTE